MRRPLVVLLLAFASSLIVGSASADQAARSDGIGSVDVVKVDGVIDWPVADYLVGSLADAERRGSAVIVQLNSPGSLGVDPVALARRLLSASVPVVVWVGPVPAHAAGGALLLVYASSYAVVAPGAGIGPIEPVDLAHRSSAGDPLLPRAAEAARRWSRLTHRPATFPTQEEPGQFVLSHRIVQDFAPSLGQLLRKLDGKRVRTPNGPVALQTNPATVRVTFHELGPGRRILHAVASPVAIYVLLLLGLAGIAFELTQAGIGVAGVAGVLALGFAVYGLVVVPFSPIGLGLFLGGQALLAADVVLRRFGPLTFGGLAAFAWGSILLFGRLAPAVDVPIWLVVVSTVGAFVYYGFALTVAQRSRDRITSTRRGLVGLVGEARGPLAPDGPVFVKGALWRGKAMDGPIPAGARVRIRGVEGLILRVEPEDRPPDGD